MNMLTRKLFLRQMGGGCMTVVLAGCGGGGGDDVEPRTRCDNFVFSGNHGHALDIPVADLDSLTDKSYSIQGAATHDHPFTLTAANLARLKAGQAVAVVTTGSALTGEPHTHDVNVGSCD
jgi:hypothetical protein